MNTIAVVLREPERIGLDRLTLSEPGAADAVVDIDFSAISSGTERLLWSGRMPHFPGMGYPLVPGYESVGRVTAAGAKAGVAVGSTVFVPGANCYGPVRGLFGGAAGRVVVPGARVVAVDPALGQRATLLALAATAYHAIHDGAALPELVVGHGVLGRLLARVVVAAGGQPTVWETNAERCAADGYTVLHPDADSRRNYRTICDASGDAALLDTLIDRLAKGGEIVLAGFYDRLSFGFPAAFMRHLRLRVAAEFRPDELAAVAAMVASGALSLDGLVSHSAPADDAAAAYHTAFTDPSCLKMVLDWRHAA